jgi:hypothetical protein
VVAPIEAARGRANQRLERRLIALGRLFNEVPHRCPQRIRVGRTSTD